MVVYVVVCTKTSDFYIGSTVGNTLKRLQKHVYSRNAAHHSELSHYLSSRIFCHTNGCELFHRSFLAFPIYKAADEQTLRLAEEQYIHRFQNARAMNINDRHTRQRHKNRSGTNRRGFENLTNSNTGPTQMRSSEIDLLHRVEALFEQKENDKLAFLLSSLGRRRLRLVNREARIHKAKCLKSIKDEVRRRHRKKQSYKYVCRVNFTRRLSTSSMRSIVFGPACPFPKDVTKDVRLCVSLNRTLGQMASNATSLSIHGREEYSCFCTQLRHSNVPEEHFRQGHIATNDISAVFDFLQIAPGSSVREELHVLWQQGAKFRSALSIDKAIDIFSQDLRTFAESIQEELPISRTIGRGAIEAWIVDSVTRYRAACADPRNYMVSEATIKIIKQLGDFFAVTPIDKNPQSLALLCMADYMRRLEARMKSTDFVAVNSAEVQGILRSHKAFNDRFAIAHVNALPYLYIIPKLHKEPARPFDRFIAGNSKANMFDESSSQRPNARAQQQQQQATSTQRKPLSSLTQLGRKVSDFLNGVLDLLAYKDRLEIQRGEPRRFWVIRDCNEAVGIFRDAGSIYTHDFSTMYQNFPLISLFGAVEKEVTVAMKFAARHFFKIDESNFDKIAFHRDYPQRHGTWRRKQTSRVGDWGAKECLEALQFLLKNTYYSNVFGVVLQNVGVPMGGPASGPAANLALVSAERSFVDRMLSTHGRDAVRAVFNNFYAYVRYIDDMASSTPSIPSRDDYYGMDLVRTGAVPPDRSTDFLCFTFTKHNELPLEVSLKNKQDKFPLLLCRFPGSLTTISESCRIGCVIGGLVNIFRTIDDPTNFARAVYEFFDVLQARSFSFRNIRTGITRFLQTNCRKQYTGFMMAQFFAPILAHWPHHNDYPGDTTLHYEYLRTMSKANAPFAYRRRFAPENSIPRPQSPPAHVAPFAHAELQTTFAFQEPHDLQGDEQSLFSFSSSTDDALQHPLNYI